MSQNASRRPICLTGLGVVILAVALSVPSNAARTWGATGHEWISGIAVELLPDELPEFLRTPDAAAEIAMLGRELDRSNAGATHDQERDPGHYVNLDDDGTAAGIPLEKLPATRAAYDTALRANGWTQYKMGYLPYSIVDGWQQLRKDFAYWRADVVMAKTATDPADGAWFEADRKLREMIIIRDLGVWSHYVGDASQPLHVSIHFNGWGENSPNPNGFTNSTKIHAHFEGEFVRKNLDRATVKAAAAPYNECACKIEERLRTLLLETHSQMVLLYQLEKRGGVAKGDQEGIGFAIARLVVGSSTLRDMIVDAWRASANMGVGYPMINVREVEAGRRLLTRKDFGGD